MTVRIMTVCTGNICRSPYAQLRLQQELDTIRPGTFEVSSAGTHALVDQSVDPGSVRVLGERGVDSDGFAARQLDERMLTDIDIVLPLTTAHRKIVLSHSPRHLKRSYTVTELARLLDAADEAQPWTERLAEAVTPEERWAALPSHLTRQRGISRVAEGEDDIADPYRQGPEAFEAMAAQVDAAIERIVAFEERF
ncbi:arsenate reductase/protein-tyrosine-phosphatase family protein [Janibacter corallicola]|uniref:arsenate reductase/protein-tyrosine-phosphatase family protein n=1 Tax=Janibacter corallicola TaxID=415212 RepID=UPI000831FDC7|nr:hypothetical protein [Janibacter corallicola]